MCTCDKCSGKTLIFVLAAWNKPAAPGSLTYSACFSLRSPLQLILGRLHAVGCGEVAFPVRSVVGSVAQTVREGTRCLNLNRISLYILFNSFSFPIQRLILDPLAGKAWKLVFSSGFAAGPLCGSGYLPILLFVCSDLSHFKLSTVQRVSHIVCFYTQLSRVLIWLDSWCGISIFSLMGTLCAGSVCPFTAGNPNTHMCQSLDCSDRDKWIVLLKQVPRWSVLKKRLGLCRKGGQRGAESECQVCRVARREDLCVMCAGQRKVSRTLCNYCRGFGERKKQDSGGE